MSVIKFIRPTPITYTGRIQVAANAYTFSFKPNKPLTWYAGQHGMIEIKPNQGKTLRRMFSLSSAPSEGVISITTRVSKKGSSFKKGLMALVPGETGKLRGPVGPMYLRNPSQNNVFIASGIGITPFRSIIVEAKNSSEKLNATLIYENKQGNDVIFKDELTELAAVLPHFSVKYITEPNKLTEENIRSVSADIGSTMYYLAGSPATIKSYKQLLRGSGAKGSQIKNDPFYGYK